MATLHVRQFPDILYRRLTKLAKQEHRSLSAEITVLLKRELAARTKSQTEVLADIAHWKFRPAPGTVPSALEMLREDRRR